MRQPAQFLRAPAVLLTIFIVDRLTKYWALNSLRPIYEIKVLPFFHLTYLENTGAAWGILRDGNTALIFVSIVLLGGLLYLRRRWQEYGPWVDWGILLVAGGALGNLYDRIAYGFVVDFLDFLVWPVFNAADSCITVGACCMAWGLHLADRKKS